MPTVPDARGYFGEFGGMRGGQHQALRRLRMFLAICFPGQEADGGVRIGNVAITVPDQAHLMQSFFIGGPVSPDFLAHVFQAIAA